MTSAGEDIGFGTLEVLKDIGFEKAECTLSRIESQELNLEGGQISLLRTTDDVSLNMSGIRRQRKGSLTLNSLESEDTVRNASRLSEMADSSEPDPAHDISPLQPSGSWSRGPAEADLDAMHRRMAEFREYTAGRYPSLILRRASVTWENRQVHYMNSNGTDLSSRVSCYQIKPLFASKRGDCTSSFNYAFVASASLERPLWEYGSLDLLMRQSGEQVESSHIDGKFAGDIVISPECMQTFVHMVCWHLMDRLMVRGTSIFRDSLGERIASSSLTLETAPVSDELAEGSYITSDGYAQGNSVIIRNGILENFLLSLYGSNKTGLSRSPSGGGYYVMKPGREPMKRIVESVERGILLTRFSGGMPSASGDFSGVAKNSYYIEGGRIRHPVREVMISGSIRELLLNVRGISSERVNLGYSIMPWMRVGGMSIFGRH